MSLKDINAAKKTLRAGLRPARHPKHAGVRWRGRRAARKDAVAVKARASACGASHAGTSKPPWLPRRGSGRGHRKREAWPCRRSG